MALRQFKKDSLLLGSASDKEKDKVILTVSLKHYCRVVNSADSTKFIKLYTKFCAFYCL